MRKSIGAAAISKVLDHPNMTTPIRALLPTCNILVSRTRSPVEEAALAIVKRQSTKDLGVPSRSSIAYITPPRMKEGIRQNNATN
jgi:hypothetical protein